MSSIAANISARWQDATNLSGVTTASLLVVFLVATGIGAVTGLALDSAVTPVAVALVAGFLGTVVAGIVRNTLLVRAWGVAGVEDTGTPLVVIVYAAVASLAGSLAGYHIAWQTAMMGPVLIGSLAGALSAVLLGLLMVTYRMSPDQTAQR
jgi:hypothetical protein